MAIERILINNLLDYLESYTENAINIGSNFIKECFLNYTSIFENLLDLYHKTNREILSVPNY